MPRAFPASPGRLAPVVSTVLVCALLCGALPAMAADPSVDLQELVLVQQRSSLDFDELVACRRAVAEVYWRHVLWPRKGPKPPLSRVLTREVLERRVRETLEGERRLRSAGIELTHDAIAAEIERMRRTTRRPAVLRELFAALHDDPLEIGECLVRPRWVRVQLAHLGHAAGASPGGVEAGDEAGPGGSGIAGVARDTGPGTVPTGTRGGKGLGDWSTLSSEGAPAPRYGHTATWTGSELIVWGGYGDHRYHADGGRYDPATDSWQPLATEGAPAGRFFHTAVWTGTEMIVWGGFTGWYTDRTNTGGRYDPLTDTWRPTSTGEGVPGPRVYHTATWTGSEMIVWGGEKTGAYDWGDGARYDPATDSWTPMSQDGAPSPRNRHLAAWTGSELIVWGGTNSTNHADGARYDPATDTWRPMADSPCALSAWGFLGAWTGSEFLVYGRPDCEAGGPAGQRYDPATDTWTAMAEDPESPHGMLYEFEGTWTGSEFVLWGGFHGPPGSSLRRGYRYDPATDSWWPTIVNARTPSARKDHTLTRAGNLLIAWGGKASGGDAVNSGASWDPDGCDPVTPAWYRDADRDGYGDPGDALAGCEQPEGYVPNRGDCRDDLAEVHPWVADPCDDLNNDCDDEINEDAEIAEEACNGLDDDCDGLVDEGDPEGGESCSTGDPGACGDGVMHCVDGRLECEAKVGAGPELANGTDDDCDGTTDEAQDSDGDGLADAEDNCPADWNPGQEDADLDGLGDVCDCAPDEDGNPPPGAVGNTLEVTDSSLSWGAVSRAGTYDVYRGVRKVLESNWSGNTAADNQSYHCHRCGLFGTEVEDNEVPAPGWYFYYVVSAACGGTNEGSLGKDSAGNERPNDHPCPCPGVDSDGDGIPDERDNCPGFRNGFQSDADGDGVGDPCE